MKNACGDGTACGGKFRVIASLEEPQVIAKILSHLQRTASQHYQAELPLGGTGVAGARQLPVTSKLKGYCPGP